MRLSALAPLVLLVLAAGPAGAARSYDNCTGFVDALPAVISTPGTWCLRKDLATAMASGAAITLATNNVTLDCNDFKVGGLSAGPATLNFGVHSDNRLNHTIRNCNLRGFYIGVALRGGGAGHLVEDNRVEGSTANGINVVGSNSTIRRNMVLDTGDSTNGNPSYFGIYGSGDGLLVLDNTVSGIEVDALTADSVGIYVAGDGIIDQNRVVGLDDTSTGVVSGIYTVGGRPIIQDNVLKVPTSIGGSFGVRCSGVAGTARGNMLVGFETPVSQCTAIGNVVNPV